MQGFSHGALMWSLGDLLQGCMVSLGQHVGTPGYHVWIILGAWDQLGTTWDDMLSPKGSPKRPQRDRGLRQHVFYEGQVQNRPNGRRVARATSTLTAFLRVVKRPVPIWAPFTCWRGGARVYIYREYVIGAPAGAADAGILPWGPDVGTG